MGLLGNLSKAALLAGIVGFCGACQQGGKIGPTDRSR